MAHLVHRHGDIRTVYDDDGHLVQFDEWGDKRKRISAEAWPDFTSAKQAFLDGLVKWGEWAAYS